MSIAVDARDVKAARATARLDRLPVFSFHRRMLALIGFIFFFELGDINSFSFAAPAIIEQWGVSRTIIALVTSATFFGMFMGANSGGWLADRLGRKRALILATCWYSGFSLLNALAWEQNGLFATRFLTGIGLSAMTAIAITYIAEMYPAHSRGKYQCWILTIGLLGIPATAFVARYCIPIAPWGWRLVFIWGGLGILFPLFASKLEESPRWFENHGRHDEAENVLRRLEARAEMEHGPLAPIPDLQPEPSDAHAFRHLFVPPNRKRTVLLMFMWMFQTLGFYGFSAWVPTLLVAEGFSMVNSLGWSAAMQLGAVPGALIASWMSDRFQRKHIIAVFSMVVAACGLAYGLSFEPMLIVVFGFLVAMFVQTVAPLLYAYTAECYPTGIRSSGTGFSYGIGRLANVAGPLIIAFLYGHYGYLSVFIYIAACWTGVAATVGLFGPRTKGKAL